MYPLKPFVRKTLFIAMCMAASTQFAQAQDAADSEEEGAKHLDSVTVTARKREESLQDVPFSIEAQSEAFLRQTGAVDMESLANNVAGFSVQNLGPGQSQIAIRGVSAGQIVRDQPGVKEQVGVYLDESVISLSLFTPDLELFDLNRVEVLRGPQGTLFGAGSLSGTVRYITNKPDPGQKNMVAEVSLATITDGGVDSDFKGMFNAPINDTTAFRAVAYYKNYGGYIDAIQPDGSKKKDVNDGERYGGRFSLLFQPTDELTITPRIVYQKVDMNGFNRNDIYNILGNEFTTTSPKVKLGSREQYTQFDERFLDEFALYDLDISYDMGTATVTSVTSYTDRDVTVLRDATQLTASITGGNIGLPEDIYRLDAPLDDSTSVQAFTQELRLSSNGAGPLSWVVGGFYSTMDRDYSQQLLVPGFEAATGIPTAGFIAPTDGLFWSAIPYTFEQYALFGELTYLISDRLSITGGLRYYDFKETRELNFDGIFADPTEAEKGKTTSNGFTPRIMASYQVSQDTVLNGQVSQGVRLGGINDPLNVPLCSPQDLETFGGRDSFKDEELTNYEIGAKHTFSNGRGVFNVALFYMEISNLQATLTAGTCSSRVVFNVPDAFSRGVEIEYKYALTDNLNLAISGSYVNAELDSTVTSVDAGGNETVIAGMQKGNQLPTTPEFQMSANAIYFWQVHNDWEGYASGTYQYVGSRYTQIGDQADGFGTVDLTVFPLGSPDQSSFSFNPELGSYSLANLRVGVKNYNWDYSIYMNNIFDEEAQLGLDQERGSLARVGYLTNQPRTLGFTVRYSY